MSNCSFHTKYILYDSAQFFFYSICFKLVFKFTFFKHFDLKKLLANLSLHFVVTNYTLSNKCMHNTFFCFSFFQELGCTIALLEVIIITKKIASAEKKTFYVFLSSCSFKLNWLIISEDPICGL